MTEYSCPWCSHTLSPTILVQSHSLLSFPLLPPSLLYIENCPAVYYSTHLLSTLLIPDSISSSYQHFLPPLFFHAIHHLLSFSKSNDFYSLLLQWFIHPEKSPIQIETHQSDIHDLMIAMFCVNDEDGESMPITGDILSLLHEIFNFLFSNDLLNAINLFLFSRGGNLHIGFSKYSFISCCILLYRSVYTFFYSCYSIQCIQSNHFQEEMKDFQNQYMKTIKV